MKFDRSILDIEIGIGIYCGKLGLSISLRLPDYSSVFQAEALPADVPEMVHSFNCVPTELLVKQAAKCAVSILNVLSL